MVKRAIVIVGPTASGKTDLALSFAQKFNGELIACDSRQVFKGLDIGTGKLPAKAGAIEKSEGVWVVQGVKIWLYDLVEPTEQLNAVNWAIEAIRIIKDVEKRERLPIIVGGTGLYLDALLKGFDYTHGANPKLRLKLEKLSLRELQSRVAILSPTRWSNLNQSDRNNARRLIRIIEIESMYPYRSKLQLRNKKLQKMDILKIGLTAPRPWLNNKINQRVLFWFDQGITEEVKSLMDSGVTTERFKQLGLEYGLIAQYISGKILSQIELVKLIQTKVRQYAKRQMTYFKRDAEITWFDVSEQDWQSKVESQVRNWYNTPNGQKD